MEKRLFLTLSNIAVIFGTVILVIRCTGISLVMIHDFSNFMKFSKSYMDFFKNTCIHMTNPTYIIYIIHL